MNSGTFNCKQRAAQAVPHGGKTSVFLFHLPACFLHGNGHSHGPGYIFRTGTEALLLCSAQEKRRERNPTAPV